MATTSDASLTWLITGANSGFGLQLAILAARAGHKIIATTRPSAKVPKELNEAGVYVIKTEITAPATEIAQLVNSLIQRFGHIDVLVNNAGFAQLGSIEEVSDLEARYQFDVNVFGLLNFTRAILPHMRERRSGTIVQFSSIAGLEGGIGYGIYSAAKFAVEGICETLALELKPFNIRVHAIEPGFFRTNFLKSQSGGQYVSRAINGYTSYKEITKANGAQPGDPVKAARRIFEVVNGTGMGQGLEWELRIPLGPDALQIAQSKMSSLQKTVERTNLVAGSTDF